MILPLFLILSTISSAENADKGYVVRVDSRTAWIDLTKEDGATPGREFSIYNEGEVLKHPVTHAVLGRVQNETAKGRIIDVSDKFSTGEFEPLSGQKVSVGQRARFTVQNALTPPTTVVQTRVGEPEIRTPKIQSPTVAFPINAMAVGDFNGSRKPQIVLASDNSVKLYLYPIQDQKPIAETILPGTGLRILGMEAASLDNTTKDSLFVSVYDESFKRFETRVLSFDNGQWAKVADLPFLTRSYQDASGKMVLISQQIIDDKSFPFGSIYPLIYQDGKYSQGRPALGHRRADWIFGFTTAQLTSGTTAILYLTPVHALRVQFGKESWRTADDDYGQTPLRVRWQEKLLEFNPPLKILSNNGTFEALFAVRNMAALGGLATPFGLFNRGELVRKRWNGLGLETAWKADLPGCAQGLAIVETVNGKQIVVAIRGSAGQSSVWVFDP